MLVTPPKRKVTFTTTLDVIYEDPALSEDLKQSRIGDYLKRQADRLRMERLLNPILEPAHRDKMWRMVQQSEQWLESRQLTMVSRIFEKLKDWKELLSPAPPGYASFKGLSETEPEGLRGEGTDVLAKEAADYARGRVPEKTFSVSESSSDSSLTLQMLEDNWSRDVVDELLDYYVENSNLKIRMVTLNNLQATIYFESAD